ncbi:MAG: amidohydrolase [Deltaproteobacteria bacterium]|nr:amidohydrolase [Deltaproteobacteria bacterium]
MSQADLIVDADSHVEETPAIWECLDAAYQERKPIPVRIDNLPGFAKRNVFWVVEGKILPKLWGPGAVLYSTPPYSGYAQDKPFTLESQALLDVEARLKDMDRAGVDVQVLYPTCFLDTVTDDLAFEGALMRAYNTWMAGTCGQRPDRLKWTAQVPLRDVPEAIREMRRARDLGAVGIAIKGTAGEKMLHYQELTPFWAEAEQLGLPVCVHVGWSHPGLKQSCDTIYGALVLSFTVPVLMGFFSVIAGGLLDRFPRLKVGFLEAGTEWVPYLIDRMDHYYGSSAIRYGCPRPARRPSDYLRDGRVYFTCEADERLLPQVVALVGEGQIMASADMPHGEAREESFREIRERADLGERVKQKMFGENAIRFYGL